ncbi:MAG TPA: hypothetical protein V6C81_20900 [Planktothrix sp.]|jgi:predicted nucleotidyltransferase
MTELIEIIADRRPQIEEIFSNYGDLQVRIVGSGMRGPCEHPDVDILVNSDVTRDEDIVVCIYNLSCFIRKPFGEGRVRAEDSLDLCMDLISRLTLVLGCALNVVDERALKHDYPVTYSKLRGDTTGCTP